MRRRIKDRGGGGGVRRGIEGVAACDERHGSEANEGFARAGACREAWKKGAWLGEGLFVGRSRRWKRYTSGLLNEAAILKDSDWE